MTDRELPDLPGPVIEALQLIERVLDRPLTRTEVDEMWDDAVRTVAPATFGGGAGITENDFAEAMIRQAMRRFGEGFTDDFRDEFGVDPDENLASTITAFITTGLEFLPGEQRPDELLSPDELARREKRRERQSVTPAEREAEAFAALKEEAIATAAGDPTLYYDPTWNNGQGGFFERVHPLSTDGKEIDADEFIRSEGQTIRPMLDDEGKLIVRRDIDENTWLGLPFPDEDVRTEPFLGGTPADFESQREIFDRDLFDSEFRRLTDELGLSPTQAEQMILRQGRHRRPARPTAEPGDQFTLAGSPAEVIAYYQNLMVDAGYLRARDIIGQDGLFTVDTFAPAYAEVLQDADVNGYGEDPNGVVEWLKRVGAARANLTPEQLALEAGLRPFAAPAYIAPDYARLSQAVRGTFRDLVGRDPRDEELALLAQRMDRDYRRKFGKEVAAARAQHNAGNRAILTGEPQGGGSVGRGVSPLDRLAENILSRFEGEIDRNQLVADTQRNTMHLMNVLAGAEAGI